MREILIATIILSALVVGCDRTPHEAGASNTTNQKIIITGSSTLAPMVLEIAKQFELEHPGVRVDVQSGGSSRGILDTRDGTADIGMVSRALRPGENGLNNYTIARDGVSIILHSQNPVTQLSSDQIIDIYKGDLENWNELGGRDEKIIVVNKAAGRATLDVFLDYFDLSSSDIRPHIIIGDNEQGIKTIASTNQSIGYVSIGTAEYSIKRGNDIKLLPINNISANLTNVANGTYPLARPLLLVTKNEPVGTVKKFIEFARSEKVHRIIKEQYFAPVHH